MSLKAKLKNLRTLGHLYKIQLGASNGHLESVRFKVKTTTDSEGRQTFVNQSGIEFIQEYLKQLEAKSWSDANDAIIKQEIINAKRALAGYLQPKSSAPLSELNPAHLSAGKSKQEQSAHTLTATAANAANSPRATRIVPPIHTSTTSGDIDYSFYLEQIAEKTVKDKTKNNVELKLGGLERRINQKDSRQNMLSSLASGNLGRMVDAVNLNRLNNQENDAFFEVSEERGAKITEKLQQIQENKKIKKLGIKSHIYDDTETRKITNQGNEKLIVTINDPKDHEIKGTTAATPPNTYEVSKTNDKDFTMTTNDPLDTIGDKMLVQWIETFKRTEGPNKVMVISDLFRDGQSLEEKTKAQEIANKIQQYCSSAGVTLKINSEPEPEPENTAASRHSPGRR